MVNVSDFIEWRTDVSEPVVLDARRVTLRSQALVVHWAPEQFGGMLIWRRPAAVVVEEEGRTTEKPIPDVTRVVQLLFWGLAAFFLVLGLWFAWRNRRGS
jgi:hypothetical protein